MLRDDVPPLIGESPVILDFVEEVSRVAAIDRPVMVIGERGTGKELVAARLHFLSARWNGPFVRLNAAALPQGLLESELFGHEAGAFTGAVRSRAGRFEQADGGSLFLDEIALASATVQEQLLRVVEYGRFERLGSSATIEVDTRLIAATNADLPALANKGEFRWDLLDRLAFEVLTVPPLRARDGDIRVLAEEMGRQMALELGWQVFPGFSETALDQLETHSWPGNVRELRNTVERAVARWNDPDKAVNVIDLNPFASPWRPIEKSRETSTKPTGGFREQVADLERQLLSTAMQEAKHNQRSAAEALDLTYDQLRHALKRHKLLPPRR